MVPAPGKHRKPEALPPAPAPVPYEDHPSSPQPRFSDPDWSPPYEDYPSWPHPGEPSPGRPPRRGDNGLDVRQLLSAPHPDYYPYPPAGPAGRPGGPTAGREDWADRGVRSHDSYDRGPQLYRDDLGPQPYRDFEPQPYRDPGPQPHRDPGPQPYRDLGPQPYRELGPQPHRDLGPEPYRDLGPGRMAGQAVLTEPDARYRHDGTGPAIRGIILQVPPPPQNEAGGLASIEDCIRLANGILAEADDDAARIMAEAAAEAVATRAAAEQAAARTRQEASAQVAEMRTSTAQGATELQQLAERVLHGLTADAAPATTLVAGTALAPRVLPQVRPAAAPRTPAQPETPAALQPAVAPRTQPGTKTAPRPATRPGAKPASRTRQEIAMRKVMACVATLALLGAATGATELSLHGFKFFVFRAAGVGQTSGNETDQQFQTRQAHAAAAHHIVAPKGHQAKKPHRHPAEVHHQ